MSSNSDNITTPFKSNGNDASAASSIIPPAIVTPNMPETGSSTLSCFQTALNASEVMTSTERLKALFTMFTCSKSDKENDFNARLKKLNESKACKDFIISKTRPSRADLNPLGTDKRKNSNAVNCLYSYPFFPFLCVPIGRNAKFCESTYL